MKHLDKNKYAKAAEAIQNATINTLFAEAVIEQKINGDIFVDNPDEPQTFYIVHPYGMTLLLGNCENENFNNQFREYALNSKGIRDKYEWMQAFPETWDTTLLKLFGNKLIRSGENKEPQVKGMIELNTRVNFEFNRKDFLRLRKSIEDKEIKIVRTDKRVFSEMPGTVVPACFWGTEDDFLNNGIGFSLFYQNKLASTAFASFINGKQLELGIETVPAYRGKGFAQLVCQSLIEYCMENNYEPIWACRLGNTGSYKLAQKTGFRPAIELPYYRLSN